MQKVITPQPLVSVVIPVFNGAKYLAEMMDSVHKSTYKNIEILLFDDGSKDSSIGMCRAFAKLYPNVRYFYFRQNRGLAHNLNKALKVANGEYICRINQDDRMTPDRIAKQVKYFQSHPDYVLVGSWLNVENDQGHRQINQFLKTDEEIRRSWLSLSPVWDAAVMYRKQAAIDVGGYDQSYWPADDLHMWYRLGTVGKIGNIQQPLTTIKLHAGAASFAFHRKHMIETYRVHQYANRFIQPATPLIKSYWFAQYIAGICLPASFNWFVYHILKKYIIHPLTKLSKTHVYAQVPFLPRPATS